ncbi:MAG: hypothetical protein JOZ10_18275, partial [Acidobacteria bacterium]|nr:hypothetical protein [Acidobacteriota bacterium]
MTFPLVIQYNSNGLFSVTGTPGALNIAAPFGPGAYSSSGGWEYNLPQLTYSSLSTTIPDTADGSPHTCNYNANYLLSDLSGSSHPLHMAVPVPSGDPACDVQFGPSIASGGDDFVQAYANGLSDFRVADADGTVYKFSSSSVPDYIEDRNGNKLLVTLNSSGATVTDSAGRMVLSTGTNSNYLFNSMNVSGLAPITIQWETVSGGFCLQSEGQSGLCAASGVMSAIQSITLPNQTQYSFQYDPTTGLLSQITYPSGGWVKYQWGTNPMGEVTTVPALNTGDPMSYRHDWPAIVQRSVSFDGTNIALQQNFEYSTGGWVYSQYTKAWTSKQTTVTS